MLIGALLGVPKPRTRTSSAIWGDLMMRFEPDGISAEKLDAIQRFSAVHAGARRRSPQQPRDDMVSDLLAARDHRDDGTSRDARPPRGDGVLHAARARRERDDRPPPRLGAVLLAAPSRPARQARREPGARPQRGRGAAALRAAVADPGALRDPKTSSGTARACPPARRSRCSPAARAATSASTSTPIASTSTRAFDRHVTFGYGVHFCLGANLARLEGRVVHRGDARPLPEWDVDEAEVELVRTSTVRGPVHVPIHPS